MWTKEIIKSNRKDERVVKFAVSVPVLTPAVAFSYFDPRGQRTSLGMWQTCEWLLDNPSEKLTVPVWLLPCPVCMCMKSLVRIGQRMGRVEASSQVRLLCSKTDGYVVVEFWWMTSTGSGQNRLKRICKTITLISSVLFYSLLRRSFYLPESFIYSWIILSRLTKKKKGPNLWRLTVSWLWVGMSRFCLVVQV